MPYIYKKKHILYMSYLNIKNNVSKIIICVSYTHSLIGFLVMSTVFLLFFLQNMFFNVFLLVLLKVFLMFLNYWYVQLMCP